MNKMKLAKRFVISVSLLCFLTLIMYGCGKKRSWENPFENPQPSGPGNTAPNMPSQPTPPDASTGIATGMTLTWTCSDPDAGDTLEYDVYFDTYNPPSVMVASNLNTASLARVNLTYSTPYYWKVIAKDNHAATAIGPVWTFTTRLNPWSVKAFMPTPRWGLTAAAVNNKIFAIGGQWGVTVVEEYDPATNTWATKTSMPTGRGVFGAAVVNNKIYAIGGYDGNGNYLDVVEEYNPAINAWSTKTRMPTARGYLVSVTVNNRIYAIGGFDGWNSLSTVEEYDPATDTWSSKTNMITPRSSLAAAVANNKIYAIGGSGGVVEEYDPITNTWTAKATMPTPRSGLLAATVNNKIYAIGNGSNNEMYDPTTNAWFLKTQMPTERSNLAGAVVTNKVYAIGGDSGGGNGLSAVEEYNPELDP